MFLASSTQFLTCSKLFLSVMSYHTIANELSWMYEGISDLNRS